MWRIAVTDFAGCQQRTDQQQRQFRCLVANVLGVGMRAIDVTKRSIRWARRNRNRNEHSPMALTGIANPTHVACHVSTALWMVYAVVPLRRVIILVATSTQASAVVLVLGRVLQAMEMSELEDDGENLPVDPTKLYRQLRYEGIVNANYTGDAVSTLSRILSYLRRDETISRVMDSYMLSGSMHSTLY